MFDDDDLGFEEALAFGTGYAMMRGGQDAQTRQIVDAINDIDLNVTIENDAPPPEDHTPVNAQDYATNLPTDWDSYIGQEPLKKRILTEIQAAKIRKARLPHTLLASGFPGVGKTTMARLMAQAMGVNIIELVPPFKSIETIVNAAKQLKDKDILFIDEIHKLTDGVGARGGEVLLKILEDGVAYLPDGRVEVLNDITIIGATTDADKLPGTVLDRFKVKPYFQPYSLEELARITIVFTFGLRSQDYVDDKLAASIARACRGTPRIIEEMVMAARNLTLVNSYVPPTTEELLEYLEVEPDGLTRTHIHYICALRQYFGRVNKDGFTEFIVGEAAMQQLLRQTKPGIGRIERFLVERGLVDRTPRGRRLTPLGIARAEQFIDQGKGVNDVA